MPATITDPAPSNFIKDFPALHAVNMDSIDNYAGPCLRSQALRPYTPILHAATTDPVLGTGGFISGYYYQIWDQIYLWGEFRFGTASINAGSGIYTITLPFTVNSILGGNILPGKSPVVGVGSVWDNSANSGKLPVNVELQSSNVLQFNLRINSGIGTRHLTDSGYITWDINDGLSWSARFQRQP